MVSAHLFRDIREHVLHERSQLTGMIDAEERVHVIAHDRQSEDANTEEGLRASDHTEHEIIRRRSWAEKKAASDGADGNFHHGVGRNKPERTRHTCLLRCLMAASCERRADVVEGRRSDFLAGPAS